MADIYRRGNDGVTELSESEGVVYATLLHGIFREWENSHYQFVEGLFSREEFEPRMERWRLNMALPGYQQVWSVNRITFSPQFRAEIDGFVTERVPGGSG